MPRVNQPFVRDRFDSGPSVRRLSDLVRRQGESAADLELRRGEIAANLGTNLANIAGRLGSSLVEYAGDKDKRELEAARAELTRAQIADAKAERAKETSIRDVERMVPPDPTTGRQNPGAIAREVGMIDPERARVWWAQADAETKAGVVAEKAKTEQIAQMLGAFEIGTKKLSPRERQTEWTTMREAAIQGGLITPEMAPEQYSPAFVKRTMTAVLPVAEQMKQIEAAIGESFTLSPGQQRFGPDGQPIASVAEPPKPPESFTLSPGSVRYGPDGKPLASVPHAPRESSGEPLVAVIRDGKSVLVPRSDAVGMTPASSREQGRPVISGDANKIADFDTAMDDLNVLTRDLGITGTSSKVGAMMPNWVTDLTGWGADSKSRQAVIDRVKQVIGKALEGGVLRKEDEIKYEKILPTIGDNSVVAKAKLQGLWESIQQRRSTTIDSLSDAGYDTSRFSARAQRTQGGAAPAGGVAPITVKTPDGQTFTFPNQAAADGFKKRAGIP